MMKTCLLFVILSLSPLFGFSGVSIVPVVVHVTDPQGNGVAGATVEITPTPMERIGHKEIDKNSTFSQILRAASKPVITDALGMVVTYSSSGYLPTATGIVRKPSGTLRNPPGGSERLSSHEPTLQP